jgi:hypothetical protein
MPSPITTEANRYKAHLKTLLTDKKVSTAEAQALVKEIATHGYSQVKAFYLAGFVARNKDAFEPGAAALVNAALKKNTAVVEGEVGKSRVGGPTHDPTLTAEDKKAGTVSYTQRTGAMQVGGINADDPLQGQVGDCYLVSSLAAVANTHPELLDKNLKTNKDGTYTVTFYARPDMSGPAKPVQVTVDGDFPTKGSSLEYISARDRQELWPLVYEKAYAQWKGGYGAIEGGMGSMALEALTGAKPAYFTITSDADPAQVFQKVKEACANKGAVVALSQPYGSEVQGMIADHAYTLLGTEEKNGQQLVKLRNPWGQSEPGHDGRDDGVFTLTAEQFAKAYAMVESVRP